MRSSPSSATSGASTTAANGASQTSTAGSQSRRMNAVSGGASRVFSGTVTAPSLAAANITAIKCTLFRPR